MSTTNTDTVSIVVTLLGFGLAIYGIVSEPLVVDSTRPTQTGEAASVPPEIPAYARLWDDPFAVYQNTDKVKPPTPALPPKDKTLFLIVPTKTQSYEDDIENRVRIRYAIERALFDQGYTAEAGNLLSTIDIGALADGDEEEEGQAGGGSVQISTPSGQVNIPAKQHHSLPIQIFRLCPLAAQLSTNIGHMPFKSVAIVWLPDAHLWKKQPLTAIQSIHAAFARLRADLGQDRWVLLGPSDSDSLAYFRNRSLENSRSPGAAMPIVQQISNPSEASQKLWVIPFRATVSESILRFLGQESCPTPSLPEVRLASASPHWIFPELGQTNIVPIRLPNRDDMLCAALIREIAERGSLPPHANTINVIVFAEWDTLYGRAMADTFRAMAGGGPYSDTENDYYADLNRDILTELTQVGCKNLIPCSNRSIKVTVVPYLRGLDGASTLYRQNYVALRAVKAADKENSDHNQNSRNTIEPAEGTTQFDYIRRLVNSMYLQKVPFWPQVERPDAIVIFGTDVYDKLALLKFLRQALKNCAYFTTDLDALYWHSHYIEYTKDLIVASSFPLRMSPNTSGNTTGCRDSEVPIEFRDSYQSAAYWTVTRCLTEGGDLRSNQRFDHADWPIIYRVGNTKPLPMGIGRLPAERSTSESSFSGLIEGLGGFLNSVTEPIIQGASPFWSICLQLTVIVVGLYALFVDVSKRMLLRREVGDELWKSALALAPSTLHKKIERSRDTIRARIQELPLRRKPWHRRSPLEVDSPVFQPGEPKDLAYRVNRIIEYHAALLEKAVCQLEVIEVALRYLSDLFALRTVGESKLISAEKAGKFAPDIQPFADYVNRDLTKPPIVTNETEEKLPTYRALVCRIFRFAIRRFPNAEFIVVGAVVFSMLAALCLQPVPFLVGPETHSYAVRVLRWIVEATALLVTFFLFHRVCYEQYRFRKLVQALEALIAENTGLSNRQLVVLIAEASEPVANLSFLPCAMTFLVFLSHLRPLGGVPFTMEMSLVLFAGLGTLTYSYARLRAAALRCRTSVRGDYKKQQVDAARLETRLKSYLSDAGPVQDNESSLVVELEEFLKRNTTTLPEHDLTLVDERALRRPGFRERLCNYLEQTIKRNAEIIDQLGEIRSGMLAPIAINPIVSALMIPVGGAGGLTLIQWLITQAR
jgi:hypothetical protein